MESVKTNEQELTSTMGSLLSTSKDEKNDGSDSTPTSSTDAFTTTLTSHVAADDPISSTSSDVLDSRRTNKTNDVSQSSSRNVESANLIMSSVGNISIGDDTSIVSAKDLLDMNITDISTEKITENVDDIVQDLENLLGEPTTTFEFTVRSREASKSFSRQHKDISMDLDEFSMDFHIPGEQPRDSVIDPANLEATQTAGIQNSQIEDINKVVCQDLTQNSFSSCFTHNSLNQSEVTSAPADIQINVEIPLSDKKDITVCVDNNGDKETNLDSVSKYDKNCDRKSDSETALAVCWQKTSEESENLKATDITTTDGKEVHQEAHQADDLHCEISNVQADEIKEQGQNDISDVNETKPVEEEEKNNESPSDLNNLCTIEVTENISNEKDEAKHSTSSNNAKEETENKDEYMIDLTSSTNEKLKDHNEHEKSQHQEKQYIGENLLYLSNTLDAKAEEMQVSEQLSLSVTTEHTMTEESQIHEDENKEQVSKEETLHFSSSEDIQMTVKGDQEKNIPLITITQFEEAGKKQDEVQDLHDFSGCREVQIENIDKTEKGSSPVMHLQREEVKEKQDKDPSNLIESQNIKGEDKRQQISSNSAGLKKVTGGVEDSSVQVTLPNIVVECIPTIEEKFADVQNVAVNVPLELQQIDGDLLNLSNVKDVVEPIIESVPMKNEEIVQNEGRDEFTNSGKIDDIPSVEEKVQAVLNTSGNTKIEEVTSQIRDTIGQESMQMDETEQSEDVADSVKVEESTESRVVVELEAESVAISSDTAELGAASILLNEGNENNDISLKKGTLDETSTNGLDESQVNQIEEKNTLEDASTQSVIKEQVNQTEKENTLKDTLGESVDEEQVNQTGEVYIVLEPNPGANEVADVQPVVLSTLPVERPEEVWQISTTIPIEQNSVMEEEIGVSQSLEVQSVVLQVEKVVTCKKQDEEVIGADECSEITSVSAQGDLQNLESNIPDNNQEIPSIVTVDIDSLKENVDSVQSSNMLIEDVADLDKVIDENIAIPSYISSEPPNIFSGNNVANSEAAQSTIDDTMEVPPDVSVKGFNMLPPFIKNTANLQYQIGEDTDVPTSSSTDVKNLNEGVIESGILPLVMEDVPDLDVLNAISTLDNKHGFMPEIPDNLESSDTMLASNSLTNDEQRTMDNIPFESCIDSSLPTVDEIFAEESDQQPVDLPDDNLETLLAVASLQGVCETDSAYNMQPEEDLSSYVAEESSAMKIQDDKIESLFEHKQTFEEVVPPITDMESENEAAERVTEEVNSEQPEQVQHVQNEDTLKEPLVINVDNAEKERTYSPKVIIKPIKPSEDGEGEVTSASGEPDEKEGSKGCIKMTITKQSDTMHSILKIYDPDNDSSQNQDSEETQPEPTVPKLIIKPIVQPNEQPQSPKMSTRSSKQVFSPSSSGNQRSASPRITIKPIVKPDNLPEPVGPVKITIKPVLKPEEGHRQKHSPKLSIKPIVKAEEESCSETKVHSPRVTIKPIVKPPEEVEQVPSPRITIKPIVKPETITEPVSSTPRVTIKPVMKPVEKEKVAESLEQPVERSSPKITIKPIVKPQEPEVHLEDFEESIKERIVLKINKGNIPGSSKELRKREVPQEEEKSEKLAKIKLKFSKGGGHPHIVQNESPNKRSFEQSEHDKSKRQKIDTECLLPGVTITPISPSHSKLKEMLSSKSTTCDKVVTIEDDDDDDVTIIEDPLPNKPSPIVISEESNQDSINAVDLRDPISEIPIFEITPDSVKTINPQSATPVVVPVTLPAPRKRGRPRKVPLQVREDFKDPKEEEPKPVVESTRPKRSCRGQSVRTTLGIKPRKPRGAGRGRGSKRGMGTRNTPTPPETPPKAAKEPKLSAAKLKQLKEELIVVTDKTEVKQIEIDDGLHKSPSQSLLAPPQTDNSTTDRADIVMYEEETRMSAETGSRAQTPAKQVVSSIPNVDLVEESQSSVLSTATTESVKVRKGPRLEVHQEPEGAVISADQLAEYYWSGGGPYMLQEQVAQFLGIKSFKRKYPNIPRRVVDMQERDFIRESGLAGEAMCDLGLTAVNSTDILDIMYSDFQDKYEEYCKHQRDRQAKDLTNKQKALSLAASQEKTKMDITQQAVQSAATWNATFNKARKDQRKACMDLQTLTVHFPKGKMKQINKPKVGHYPVALVPGQFTDYYAEFTPTEINNLPLNTLCYEPIARGNAQEMECDSQTDGSGSESDSSTSDSDSSYSGSSDGEDCTLCNKPTMKRVAVAQ